MARETKTTLEPLTNHIQIIEQATPNMRVRGALIMGSQKAVIFDTLVLPHELASVKSLCEGKELIVVYSHADWDHVWGTCGLEYATVIGHENCLKRFNDPKDVKATLKAYQENSPELYKDIELIAPHKTFDNALSLDLGDVTVELSFLPGHSLDGIVAFIPEDGVLLAGDAVETALPVINDDSPLSTWLSKLQDWANNERVNTVVPSHGEIQGRELLSYNITYLTAMKNSEAFSIPYEMDDFYTTVHAQNQKLAPTLD